VIGLTNDGTMSTVSVTQDYRNDFRSTSDVFRRIHLSATRTHRNQSSIYPHRLLAITLKSE